ncbi:MAG: hypothetical protein CVV18_01050 [Gammaproteobacteria bacterium HGW-Gammaproteobacteria-8]|nr:MAG: hypothetical protein CVV18_01050 [Gammaproteobacteria bacterium HGW-Gammaproteobacteria-8]
MSYRFLNSALLTLLLSFGVGAGTGSAQAAEAPSIAQLMQRAAQAWAAEDHAGWTEALEALHRQRPWNHDFMRQLVIGYALTDQTAKAFSMMLTMQQQGLAENWDEIEAVESLRSYPLYEYLRDLMREAGQPFGEVRTAAMVERKWPMPEAIAQDPETGRVFVGTVRDGLVLVRAPGAAGFEVFADPERVAGLQAVFALHVDAERGHLWAATGGASQYRNYRISDYGRTALIQLDLGSGAKLGEFRVLPDGVPHLLGAITQAADGTVYAADSLAPIVYRLVPGAERPEAWIAQPTFTGLRGIALSADERRLYVSDYELGLYFFELGEEARTFRLGAPETLNLGGIDGLYRWRNSLVVIQNGITPERVLRLDLSEDGTVVEQIAAIAVAQPEFDIPTWGTLAGDDLLFFGASHWQHVDSRGRVTAPPLADVPILRSPVDRAENVVVGSEMIERIKHGDAAKDGKQD